MPESEITNGMLYELLKEFKADVNRRFDEIHDELNEIRSEIRALNTRVDILYQERDKVRVTWTRQLGWKITGIVAAASVVMQLIFQLILQFLRVNVA